MKRSVVAVMLIALMVVCLQPFTLTNSATAAEKGSLYTQGLKAGRKAARGDTKFLEASLNFVYGFLLGPVAVGHSLLVDYLLGPFYLPQSELDQISEKKDEYRRGFKQAYLQTKRRNRLGLRVAGWGSWVGTWFVLDQLKE